MRKMFSVVLAAIVFAACASSGTQTSRRSNNIITAEEIAQSTARNAYEAVSLLRPHLLNLRGISSPTTNQLVQPVVYVDNLRQGDVDAMHNIDAQVIQEIKYLRSSEATTRFGTGHMGGAFLITTKTR